MNVLNRHHDALELPAGGVISLQRLRMGQCLTVLELPHGARVRQDGAKSALAAKGAEPGLSCSPKIVGAEDTPTNGRAARALRRSKLFSRSSRQRLLTSTILLQAANFGEGARASGDPLSLRARSPTRSEITAMRHLSEEFCAFDPEQLEILRQAYVEACNHLKVYAADQRGREAVATRVIDLAKAGVMDARALRDRVPLEAIVAA
ncbi:MAG: hypothetical protein JO000_19140 [Alphaproteobacteria bacterium]|nr:hypothetical protein [Alphaproteobacteria bacterium]